MTTKEDFKKVYVSQDLGEFEIEGNKIRVTGCLHVSWCSHPDDLYQLKDLLPIMRHYPKNPTKEKGFIGMMGGVPSLGIHDPESWHNRHLSNNAGLCLPGMLVIGPEELNQPHNQTDVYPDKRILATMLTPKPDYLVEFNRPAWIDLDLGMSPKFQELSAILIWMLTAYRHLSTTKQRVEMDPYAWFTALGGTYQESPWNLDENARITKLADKEVVNHGLGWPFLKTLTTFLDNKIQDNEDIEDPARKIHYNGYNIFDRVQHLIKQQRFHLIEEAARSTRY